MCTFKYDVVETLVETNKHGSVDNHFKVFCIQVGHVIDTNSSKIDFNILALCVSFVLEGWIRCQLTLNVCVWCCRAGS